jgi:hypothetical protein
MMTILSKKTERAAVGKKSAFQLRGRQVDIANAEGYLKRKGITTRDIMAWRATGAATPTGLHCFTPEPIRPYPAAPKMFHIPESLFADIRVYIVGSFEAGTWVSNGVEHLCFSIKENHISSKVFEDIRQSLISACLLISEESYPKAFTQLESICSRVRDIVNTESPETIARFIEMMILVRAFGRPELVELLLKQFAEMSAVVLPTPAHPMSRIFAALSRLEPPQFEEMALKAWDCMNDVFQKVLGLSHLSTLTSKLDRLDTATTSLDAESPDGHLEIILKSGREESGSDALRSIAVLQGLGTYFFNRKRYAELQETGGEIVNRVTNWDAMDPEGIRLYRCGFEFMATAQFALCQFEQAKSSFELLIELASADLGWENSQTWEYKAKFEECLRKLGLMISR